jgi:hypothetical protein
MRGKLLGFESNAGTRVFWPTGPSPQIPRLETSSAKPPADRVPSGLVVEKRAAEPAMRRPVTVPGRHRVRNSRHFDCHGIETPASRSRSHERSSKIVHASQVIQRQRPIVELPNRSEWLVGRHAQRSTAPIANGFPRLQLRVALMCDSDHVVPAFERWVALYYNLGSRLDCGEALSGCGWVADELLHHPGHLIGAKC